MIHDPEFVTAIELDDLELLLNKNKDNLNANISTSDKIIDINEMIKTHLSILRNNNSKKTFIPYLNRLKKLLK